MNSNTQTSPRAWLAGLPLWTVVTPIVAGIVLATASLGLGTSGIFIAIVALALAGSVFAAVHHAETVAHRVGEPYGTLVLALAVTLIEVALIVSLMIAGGTEAAALARDTVFAAVMIILNGIIGLCLLVGGLRHRQQSFSLDGVSAALVALAAIVVLALVFPNYTVTTPGPYYSPSQLVLIAVVSLVIYGAFVFAQTIGHRNIFVEDEPATEPAHYAPPPGNAVTALGAVFLMASSGLTTPAVSVLSLYMHTELVLGIDTKSTVLLILSLFITAIALRTGRTIVLHGIVLLVIFVVYLFTTVVP